MEQFLYPSQKKQRESKRDLPAHKVKELHEAAIKCILEDSRPFGDFRKEGMRRFLSIAVPGYVGPHRVTVQKRLKPLYHEMRQKMKEELKKVNHVALTTDFWKSLSGSYFLCLTVHYFNKDFDYINLVAGFRRVKGEHTSERIKKFISYEIEKLQIKDKVVSITTDNANDIKSATSTGFGIRFSCAAHLLNLIVQNGLILWRKPNAKNK